ncbi:hydrogenase maturation protease [Anaerosacchariphilus polymeriproducens]|uniref:Hydrogenase maturation protease n=1 Tax=Anaerosacchariphilus polymeriproducens TaxID=1812858 RepID=A0A371ASI9_9FIRM|nr:hydrogenase maturation protease [Anaerosacchariphilus polymeriproducens]RDU22534.1 hypothetical protein DWV06_14730 [Anaerosacchariphilus polymeriproducens]
MAVKCIAIGNRIMGDDGIGIIIVENLYDRLRRKKIEIIYGESDIEYVLDFIEDGDFIFILDAAYYGKSPGTVTFVSINDRPIFYQEIFSQHQPNLLSYLRNLGKYYNKEVEGYFIGIEIEKIDFGFDISNNLNKQLIHICEKIYQFICEKVEHLNR